MVDDEPGVAAKPPAKIDAQSVSMVKGGGLTPGCFPLGHVDEVLTNVQWNEVVNDMAVTSAVAMYQVAAEGIDPCEAKGSAKMGDGHRSSEKVDTTRRIPLQHAFGHLLLCPEVSLTGKRAGAVPTGLDGDGPVEGARYRPAWVEAEVGENRAEGGGGLRVVPS